MSALIPVFTVLKGNDFSTTEGPLIQFMLFVDELLEHEDNDVQEQCDDVSLNTDNDFLVVESLSKESRRHKTTAFTVALLKSTVMMCDGCYQLQC